MSDMGMTTSIVVVDGADGLTPDMLRVPKTTDIALTEDRDGGYHNTAYLNKEWKLTYKTLDKEWKRSRTTRTLDDHLRDAQIREQFN